MVISKTNYLRVMDYSIAPKEIATEIARRLLEVKAIKLSPKEPFTWSSGWKSPIYCDNRITLSYPGLRADIKGYLSDIIRENYPQAEGIAGVATAGIPQGALIAEELNLPFLYVRSKPKGHGLENLIEGKIDQGQKVVVIEDLISTGGSSLAAIEGIRKAGGEVLGLLAIFNYGFDLARKNCQEADVNVHYLSDYPIMIEEARKEGYVAESEMASLENWRKEPSNW